jgi:hypothetical protein
MQRFVTYTVHYNSWKKDWLDAAQDWAAVHDVYLEVLEHTGFFRKRLQFCVSGGSQKVKCFIEGFNHWLKAAQVEYFYWENDV